MRNIRVVLAYDGTGYCGFQLQKNQPTIQGVLEEALGKILAGSHRVVPASRTDAGVHALGQVVHFHTEKALGCVHIKRALNALMPPEIRALEVEQMPEAFHARFSAWSKRYRYRVFTGPVVPPEIHRYVYHAPWLTPECRIRMDHAAGTLLGASDMACFMSTGTPVTDTTREVFDARVVPDGCEVHFLIEATGFLRHAVRTMMGTLLDVGAGKLSSEEFKQIIGSRQRHRAGRKAPAQGLCLCKVHYPDSPGSGP